MKLHEPWPVPKPGISGVRRVVHATRYSAQGLRSAWRHEAAFRQEVCLTVLLVPLAFWLGETVIERLLMIGSLLIVLIVELLNSAIETAIDRVGHELHELSGRAKDIGSAAVFVSLLLVALTWGTIIYSHYAP